MFKISFLFNSIAYMKIYSFYILFFWFLLTSCDSQNCHIEDTYVNFNIDLSLPEYSELIPLGNSIFIEGGHAGIIIYHLGKNDYRIYDRKCSYEPSLECSYIDSINSTIAFCNCCSSAFSLNQEGHPLNSPALCPLKKYSYSITEESLHIFN